MSALERNNRRDAKAGCGAHKPPHRLRQLGGKLVPLGCKRARGTLKHQIVSARDRKAKKKAARRCWLVVFALRQQKRQR